VIVLRRSVATAFVPSVEGWRGCHAIDGLQRLNPGRGAAEFVPAAQLGREHQLHPGSLGDVGEHAGQFCMNRCQRFDGRRVVRNVLEWNGRWPDHREIVHKDDPSLRCSQA